MAEPHNLLAKDIAARMHVNEGTVSRLRRAEGALGLDKVLAIHRGLGLSIDAMVDFDPPVSK